MTGERANTLTLITFWVDDLLLGVDIARVQEINRCGDLTVVPKVAPRVRGIVNLRGELVTVMDLKLTLKRRRTDVSRTTRTIVVSQPEETIGLLVDGVRDVLTTTEDRIEPLPSHVDRSLGQYFLGVVQQPDALVVLLDIDAVARADASVRGSVPALAGTESR